MDQNTEQFVTTKGAAQRLGVGAPTLRKRIRRGDLTVYFDPCDDRRRLFRVADLDALQRPVAVRAKVEQPTEVSVA